MQVETILSPSLFSQVEDLSNKTVVVIDILRATSTITTILNNGASSVIPVASEEEANFYKSKGYLVGGERGGETIPGFHFGNSPFHYSEEVVNGNDVVLTTTNGTLSIDMAKEAKEVLVGSFLNLTAVCDYLNTAKSNVVLFCAGWKYKVNLEDSLFAGAVALQLENATYDDASLVAMDAYKAAQNDLFAALKNSSHFNRLASKGVTKDIEYCCQTDIMNIVGRYAEGKLIAI